MFGLPTQPSDRYKPVILASRAVSTLSSDAAAPTRLDVPAVGAIEIQGDPVGVDFYTGVNGQFVGPFRTFRGDIWPGVTGGSLYAVQTSGSGTLRLYWWAPEIAPIRLAASAAAAMSGGSLSVAGTATMTADDATPPSGLVPVKSFHVLYDSADDNYDRWHGARSDRDDEAVAAEANHASVAARLFGLNQSSANPTGVSWDRLKSFTPGDAIPNPAKGILGTLPFLHVWDAANNEWNRWHGTATSSDAQGSNSNGELAAVANRNYAYNGASWDRVRTTGSATGALMPGYKFYNVPGDALDANSTGAKLTYTCPAGKDAEAFIQCEHPGSGAATVIFLELRPAGGGTILLRRLNATSLEADCHIGPVRLTAGDAVRVLVSVVAGAAVTFDASISVKELR